MVHTQDEDRNKNVCVTVSGVPGSNPGAARGVVITWKFCNKNRQIKLSGTIAVAVCLFKNFFKQIFLKFKSSIIS